MKNGICPKCGIAQVYSGANVSMKGGSYGSNSVPITGFSSAPLDNYVCANCGYVESYISNTDKLKKIKDKWEAVPPKR